MLTPCAVAKKVVSDLLPAVDQTQYMCTLAKDS